MLKQLFKQTRNESGMSVVEIMVSAVIIIIVLTSSALAITNAMSTGTIVAQRNQAAQFAQDIISVAKQAPFERIALRSGGPETPTTGCEAQPLTFNNLPTLTQPIEYPELVYCQMKTVKDTNLTYKIYTDITQVPTGNFDSTTGVNISNTGYVPIRITVTVLWGENNELISSYVRTPTISECIPQDISSNNLVPDACVIGRN